MRVILLVTMGSIPSVMIASRRYGVAFTLAFTIMVGISRGELPPWVYKERQDKAPEALVIKVRSATRTEKVEKEGKTIDWKIEAEVEKVERSATRLKPGAVIEIRYVQHTYFQPMVGPSEIPALREGERCPAYLDGGKDGKLYVPAAGGYSFRTLN
ncbi:MAG: hypothetical protein V7609_1408 [Verrucomicrobiota bacterium]